MLAQAKALAEGPPSRAAFLGICRLIERGACLDGADVVARWIPTLRPTLSGWPASLRMAPWLWINRLVSWALPVEALHLVSALSLTAAMSDHWLSTRHYPLLLFWLSRYPEDGPAPEGISLSFRDAVAEALRAAARAEADARYHPSGDLEFDESYHHQPEDHHLIFGSHLMRQVRVLDASWEPTRRALDWDPQGILDGRGLTVGEIVAHLPSEALEVLDLWGQPSTPRAPFAAKAPTGKAKARLARLRVLNLGGGHPLGDEAVRMLAKACPALEALSLRPGQAGQVLTGYDFDDLEDAERASLLQRYWNVNGNDDIARMRITPAGWRALARLPLKRVCLGRAHSDHGFGEGVTVETLSVYAVSSHERVARWEHAFEP